MSVIDYDYGISAVDSGYVRPQLDAIHLIVERGRAAVVDTGTQHSVAPVLAALRDKGIAPEAVDYVILTHIHLDHAGGAGALMQALPAARLVVHPRGVRHMVDPSRLVEGTVAVYGAAETQRRYGDILPVPAARVLAAPADGMQLELAGRALSFYETPGHARHHVVVHDARSGRVFAGDTFGLSYRELDEGDRQFLFPTTSPVQFEPEPYHRSVDLIASLAKDAVYLTHYSELRRPRERVQDLHRLIDAHAAIALRHAGTTGAERERRLYEGVCELLLTEARRYGTSLSDEEVMAVYGEDAALNAQGLAVWLDARVR
ncbi:MAG TPA: MBL fold metallo-hydrolase [Burkholderiales bacterium]|nr:MBL fold metallo-hydrolase [Burkholderiales bacterium]